MILSEVLPPEDVGPDLIQIVSTKHVDEYAALPSFQQRHVDGSMLLAKAEEAAQEAYRLFVQRSKVAFQGVAKSASTGLAIVFSIESQRQQNTVGFVMLTAMVKPSFTPRDRTDTLIRISSKKLTFDGLACSEIGPNVYTPENGFAFDPGANVGGILQDMVVADLETRRQRLAAGFVGHLGSDDGYIHYAVEIDSLGNAHVSRAWWKNSITTFAAVEVA